MQKITPYMEIHRSSYIFLCENNSLNGNTVVRVNYASPNLTINSLACNQFINLYEEEKFTVTFRPIFKVEGQS